MAHGGMCHIKLLVVARVSANNDIHVKDVYLHQGSRRELWNSITAAKLCLGDVIPISFTLNFIGCQFILVNNLCCFFRIEIHESSNLAGAMTKDIQSASVLHFV